MSATILQAQRSSIIAVSEDVKAKMLLRVFGKSASWHRSASNGLARAIRKSYLARHDWRDIVDSVSWDALEERVTLRLARTTYDSDCTQDVVPFAKTVLEHRGSLSVKNKLRKSESNPDHIVGTRTPQWEQEQCENWKWPIIQKRVCYTN